MPNSIPYPPADLAGVGGGVTLDFFEGGRALFEHLRQKEYFDKHSTVLDVGCGIGRLAVHFAPFLHLPGRYEGFDVELERIDWLTHNVTPLYPLAGFQWIPLRNSFYNATAEEKAEDLEFPYGADSFDFVLVGSVFTHLSLPAAQNYLNEIARVMKPDGRCWASFYLMNDERRAGIEAGTAQFTFPHGSDGWYAQYEDNPDQVAAFEEATLLEMIAQAGLRVREPTQYGQWHAKQVHDQDLMLLARR